MRLALDRLPVHKECDGIFRLRNTIVRFACGDAGRGACHNAGRDSDVLQDPAANINVVG